MKRSLSLRFISERQRRWLRADEFGPGRRCSYCGRRMFPFARVALAYDGEAPAHLRCVSVGRMPLFINRKGRS